MVNFPIQFGNIFSNIFANCFFFTAAATECTDLRKEYVVMRAPCIRDIQMYGILWIVHTIFSYGPNRNSRIPQQIREKRKQKRIKPTKDHIQAFFNEKMTVFTKGLFIWCTNWNDIAFSRHDDYFKLQQTLLQQHFQDPEAVLDEKWNDFTLHTSKELADLLENMLYYAKNYRRDDDFDTYKPLKMSKKLQSMILSNGMAWVLSKDHKKKKIQILSNKKNVERLKKLSNHNGIKSFQTNLSLAAVLSSIRYANQTENGTSKFSREYATATTHFHQESFQLDTVFQ